METKKGVTKSFIAVHVGAGFHGTASTDKYKAACQKACEAGLKFLDSGGHALDGATAAVTVLEDNPMTNAGTGSNLTLEGNVECDASIMDGESLLFGAVGALSGVKNPICVARELVREQIKGELTLGRVPPSFLASNGALKWARDHGTDVVSGSDLVSQKALSAYRKQKKRLAEANFVSSKPSKVARTDTEIDKFETDELFDTVGVVCVDSQGNACSALSSGGIALKFPGRVGQAATFGSGCWAQNGDSESEKPVVACCTTGCGEHIMRTLLAKECCDSLAGDENASLAITSVFKTKFLDSPMLKQVKLKYGGALAVKCWDGEVEMVWGHTTKSMCIGYMSSGDKAAKAIMSRLPDASVPGISLSVEGKLFRR